MDQSLMAMLLLKVAQEEVVEVTMLEMSSSLLESEWRLPFMLLLRLQLVQSQRLACGAVTLMSLIC